MLLDSAIKELLNKKSNWKKLNSSVNTVVGVFVIKQIKYPITYEIIK